MWYVVGTVLITVALFIGACVVIAVYAIITAGDPHDHARFEDGVEKAHDPEIDDEINSF